MEKTIDEGLLVTILIDISASQTSRIQAKVLALKNILAPTNASVEDQVYRHYNQILQQARNSSVNLYYQIREQQEAYYNTRIYQVLEVTRHIGQCIFLEAVSIYIALEQAQIELVNLEVVALKQQELDLTLVEQARFLLNILNNTQYSRDIQKSAFPTLRKLLDNKDKSVYRGNYRGGQYIYPYRAGNQKYLQRLEEYCTFQNTITRKLVWSTSLLEKYYQQIQDRLKGAKWFDLYTTLV